MEKLERYLDQVCRGIGGPPEMRQHVRQEMREHLLDAVAQHQAAGLSEIAALDKAIEEFGKPDEVRVELEATHGQRMTWIIDKAMQWKERTMKAKWLWMTWTYLTLALVIVLAVNWIIFANLFLLPKFQKLMHDGMIDRSILEEEGPAWMTSFLIEQFAFFKNNTTWLVLLAIAAVGLFEWRVKSENKAWMRLSGLGTAAVGLTLLGVLLAGSMVIIFCLGMPALGTMSRPFALEQVSIIDTAMTGLDDALAKKDWQAMQVQVGKATEAATRLSHGPALTSLTPHNDTPTLYKLRGNVRAGLENLGDARLAIASKDAAGVQREATKFAQSFDPVREAAKRLAR